MTTAELSMRDQRILRFERQWFRHPGVKDSRIWQTFGITPTRYYQVLGALMDMPAALEFDPVTVNRLRKIRDARGRKRLERNLGGIQ